MPSNDFLTPGTTTDLTLLFDAPKEGESRFGPFRAYRVRTPDGGEHTFLPPRSLFPTLDRLQLRRGSTISVRTTTRESEDGRVFPKYDVLTVGAPRPQASPLPPERHAPSRNDSMLACVALKAAVSHATAFTDAGGVLSVADTYLAWLQVRST